MEADAKLERLFFALWPPSALQRELAALADTALPPHRGGRRTYTQNLHLTLVFLGAADAATRARLERGADALHVLAFELQLDRIGCFRRRGLLWTGASVIPPALQTLVSGLHAVQAGCGLTPETRAFQAHVTLARHLRRCPPERAMASIFWPVGEFVLVRSGVEGGGGGYDVLRTWTLG